MHNCKIIENVTSVFEKLKKLESGAKEYLKIMVSEAWPEEGRILRDRAIRKERDTPNSANINK